MNDKKDNCINCNALITYDTSTWGYCKKCDHVVDDAIKRYELLHKSFSTSMSSASKKKFEVKHDKKI